MAPLDELFLDFQTALAGRYSIDSEIGRGGMGIVYLAREIDLDRPVAIKLLPPERAIDTALRERFLREARLAAKLSHPNIIPIHSVDDTGGFVYYVMSYVDGESLAQRVRTRGPLPASDGVRVLRETAWALASAHEQGVVHRDVKPDNILIESASNRVLVADFGIAAALGDVAGDGVSGTPEFMSPEQALGAQLDARSDLYSLGATAYFAFTGRLLFEGDSPTEVLAKQVTEAPKPLGSLGMPVPRKVAALVDRCLAKDPAQRPASAAALAEQLGVAIELRRELPAPLRNFVKREGRLDGGGTILGATTVVGVAVIAAVATQQPLVALGTMAAGALMLPFAGLTLAARRLASRGFAHMDLAPAFKAELESSREELAVELAKPVSKLEKGLRRIVLASIATLGLTAPIVFGTAYGLVAFAGSWTYVAGNLFALSLIATSVSGVWYLSLQERRRDVDTTFWSRLWDGRVGRAAFALGRALLRGKVTETAITHRATELSLGMAAENLFAALPRGTREELGDVPGMLHRLQDDAQELRRHIDQLQDVLTEAGDEASTAAYEALRRDRDTLQAKLGETVGALESIRLNLLRMQTGALSVGGLTTTIAEASEVSREVTRLLAGQDEVRRVLRAD